MIGHVNTGKSFLGCISYDLEDKQELSEEQKETLSRKDGLQHKNRAEVLAYNKCFGNKYELAAQFRDVVKLSRRVEKPVFHFAIRLAPGDQCSRDALLKIGEACVKEFDVQDNQYLVLLHKDTPQPHIHIVANRVGFDGKVAKDSNSYLRMATLCRRLEKELGLTAVLSPRKFLSKEERLLPRQDSRKLKMQADIKNCLKLAHSLEDFSGRMQQKGYKVIKGRGISFIDDKKVKAKGSELGFSLSKIEKILEAKKTLGLTRVGPELEKTDRGQEYMKMPYKYLPISPIVPTQLERSIAEIISTATLQVSRAAVDLVAELFKAPYPSPEDHSAAEAMQQYYRYNKKKKKKRGLYR